MTTDNSPQGKQSALEKVVKEYENGTATKAMVMEALGKEKVEAAENQTEQQAREQRLLEVMGPERYNDIMHEGL